MNIKVAKSAGFCFGVSRAMKLAEELSDSGKRVTTLGPIIHNPQAVAALEKKGVTVAKSLSDCKEGCTVVIRSHGVPKKVYDELRKRNLEYEDATCPFVEKIHRIVERASAKGDIILIAGDKNHPEVEGIMGFATTPVFVFESLDELQKILDNIPKNQKNNITAVSQTTFDSILWKKSEKFIEKVCTNAKIFDTICDATSKRQKEAEQLSRESDLMIVIGGRQSSNTAKLKSICQKNCKTILCETADELDERLLKNGSKIGITAGASTPAVIIKSVLERTKKIIDTVDNKEELL